MNPFPNFGKDEYSIPEEIAASEEIINDYKEKSVSGSLSTDRFGGLNWSVTEDREYEVKGGCMPPANKLNTELRSAISSSAQEDLERSVFYNMGAAVGLHGQELTEDRPGEPDYESIAQQLFSSAHNGAKDGYWGQEVKEAYRDGSFQFREDITEAARSFEDIMDEV